MSNTLDFSEDLTRITLSEALDFAENSRTTGGTRTKTVLTLLAETIRRLEQELAEFKRTEPLKLAERNGLLGELNQVIKDRDEAIAMYNDLLMQVSNKYPDETRHETAKRYIRSYDQGSACGPCEKMSN
jgi:molybdopterin converting factor small subunit